MKYGKALSLSGDHRSSLTILNRAAVHFNNSIVEIGRGDNYKALGYIKLAERAYYRAWLMCPGRFYPKYLLAKLYISTGQHSKALSIAKELIFKKIKIESKANNEILTEMKKIIHDKKK